MQIKTYLIIGLSLIFITLGSFYLYKSKEKTDPLDHVVPFILNTPIPVFSLNKPLDVIKQKIAEGQISKEKSELVIKNNKQPMKVTIPKTTLQSSDNSVSIKSETPNEPVDIIVPEGGATIQLPEQKWNIKIEREYSPFKVELHALPEPAVGLGYDAATLNLDGANLNLGNISVGPYATKSILSNNNYLGAEVSKSLGRVNLNVGYGIQIGTGLHGPSVGVSINFR